MLAVNRAAEVPQKSARTPAPDTPNGHKHCFCCGGPPGSGLSPPLPHQPPSSLLPQRVPVVWQQGRPCSSWGGRSRVSIAFVFNIFEHNLTD